MIETLMPQGAKNDSETSARSTALHLSLAAGRRSPEKIICEEPDEIQAAGFAVDDQEFAAELYAIAAPVRNEAREVVAAVNLAAPSSMISLEELVDALGPHLVSTADRIFARLGYRRDDEMAREG